ncbi:hypothetical protein S40293_06286 [Stachybotrys chartarum IBT 40293]|nr:hypothetical protein S40293_06286 [Stachybotrys chartarum IBT 40293]
MIGTSFAELVFIRIAILCVRYSAALYAAALACLVFVYGAPAWQFPAAHALCLLLAAEATYALFIWQPYKRRLLQPALHPPPLSRAERRALFEQCLGNTTGVDTYLRGWFMGAEMKDICRENMREFLLWAFFEQGCEGLDPDGPAHVRQDLDEYVALIEQRLGQRLADGRGPAKSLRLTLDAVPTAYRGLMWYLVIFLVDQLTHILLTWNGYQYYARAPSTALDVFPPRPQDFLSRRRSAAPALSYWFHPHSDDSKVPLIFFHGIGVGLWTYIRFLLELMPAPGKQAPCSGVMAIEFLPVSFRLTAPPPDKTEFLRQMTRILEHHGWASYAIASHSYGSVLTTHMLRSPSLGGRVASIVLIDPVTICLHLPSVAYNFTRRQPRRANEWQLWYFASMDPAVALCLGRNFFWRENIIWKEDLMGSESMSGSVASSKGRGAAVCLSGKDLIVDTAAVAEYLADQGGLEVVTFPHLDHAQAFDDVVARQRLVRLIGARCSTVSQSSIDPAGTANQ